MALPLVPVVLWKVGAIVAGSIVWWEWLTGDDGEPETVTERVTTNLGALLIVAAGAVGVAWIIKGKR